MISGAGIRRLSCGGFEDFPSLGSFSTWGLAGVQAQCFKDHEVVCRAFPRLLFPVFGASVSFIACSWCRVGGPQC